MFDFKIKRRISWFFAITIILFARRQCENLSKPISMKIKHNNCLIIYIFNFWYFLIKSFHEVNDVWYVECIKYTIYNLFDHQK